MRISRVDCDCERNHRHAYRTVQLKSSDPIVNSNLRISLEVSFKSWLLTQATDSRALVSRCFSEMKEGKSNETDNDVDIGNEAVASRCEMK